MRQQVDLDERGDLERDRRKGEAAIHEHYRVNGKVEDCCCSVCADERWRSDPCDK